jgi:hypothetical protein
LAAFAQAGIPTVLGRLFETGLVVETALLPTTIYSRNAYINHYIHKE